MCYSKMMAKVLVAASVGLLLSSTAGANQGEKGRSRLN